MLLGNAKKQIQRIWSDPESLGSTLLVWFVDEYGDQGQEDNEPLPCLQWEPETIWMELTEDVGIIPPKGNFDRLMAAILVQTSDRFWHELDAFIRVCNMFSGSTLDLQTFDPADAHEISWGITEAVLLDPPSDVMNLFSADIRAYIQATCSYEGILNPPGVLRLGGYTPEKAATTLYQFSDDPDLYSTVYSTGIDKSNDIVRYVNGRASQLIEQLQTLPLQNGSAEGLVQKLIKLLPKETPEV